MEVPIFAAVTSAAVMTISDAGGNLEPAVATGSATRGDSEQPAAAMNRRLVETTANVLVSRLKREEATMLDFFMMQVFPWRTCLGKCVGESIPRGQLAGRPHLV
jgi:hypothetical protein